MRRLRKYITVSSLTALWIATLCLALSVPIIHWILNTVEEDIAVNALKRISEIYGAPISGVIGYHFGKRRIGATKKRSSTSKGLDALTLCAILTIIWNSLIVSVLASSFLFREELPLDRVIEVAHGISIFLTALLITPSVGWYFGKNESEPDRQ